MFEGVVVAILNKFLKPYVKNLDSSQLKLSVFSGDVSLKELEVKPDALADLNLPVRIRAGFLQDLTLKIPWRSLYTSHTVVAVKGLYLLVSPSTEFKFDPEKAAKEAKAKKQSQLEQIEEKKRIEQEGSTKDEKSAGFVDKLVTQIVKNLEITIENIHVRYEDNVTDPEHPFAFGVTLEEVSARTTDSDYKEKVIKEAVEKIYKLLKLKCLSVYWNANPNRYAKLDLKEWKKSFYDGIARQGESAPENYHYLLEPFSSTAKLMLNKKPGQDMEIPRVLLDFVLEQIGLHLSRQQFLQVMRLVEGFDMMALNLKYLKYRAPGRPKGKENVRRWWKYAMNAVLNEDVRRRLRMWSWKHIHSHFSSLKVYRKLYLRKLLGQSLDKGRLDELEDKLDVFNINIGRGLAEVDARAYKKVKEKEKAEQAKKGFLSRWFGGSTKEKEAVPVAKIAGESIEMSESEKKKLYEAIGYSEDASIAKFPEEYVEIKMKLKLVSLTGTLEGEKDSFILKARLDGAETSVDMRPSANGVSVRASSSVLSVFGMPDGGLEPVLLEPRLVDESLSVVSVAFDLNPLGKKVDQRLKLDLPPSQIVVHMPTINSIVSFFDLPPDIHLQEMSSIALDQFNSLKERSRASVQHAIGKRNLLDLAIHVKSPYVILPENGVLTESASIIVVDLGKFSMKSNLQEELPSLEDATQEQLDEQAYDNFSLEMTNFSACLAPSKSKWEEMKSLPKSQMHIVYPLGFNLILKKSIIPDDIRLPSVKMSGTLPSIDVAFSDKKLKDLIKIVESLPLPETKDAVKQPAGVVTQKKSQGKMPRLAELGLSASNLALDSLPSSGTSSLELEMEDADLTELEKEPVKEKDEVFEEKEPAKNILKFVGDFKLNKISAVMSQHKDGQDNPVCDFTLSSVTSSVSVSDWDVIVDASVGPLAVRDLSNKDEPLELLKGSTDAELLTVKFTKANLLSPVFESTHHSVMHKLVANVSSLHVTAEEESLHRLIDFFVGIVPEQSKKTEDSGTAHVPEKRSESPVLSFRAKKATQFALEASLREFGVSIRSGQKNLGELYVEDVKTDLALKADVIDVSVGVKDLSVLDGAEETKYKKIVQIAESSGELFKADIRVHQRSEDEKEQAMDLDCADVEVKVVGAALKVAFINSFIQNIVDFALGFQPSDEMIETAKKKAAEMASMAKDKMKENSNTRIKLDIQLAAPQIIAPRNCLSDERLELDLGQITLANHFIHKQSPNLEYKVLIDSLQVSLTDLRVARKGLRSGPDLVLIEPVKLKISIDRCLSVCHEGIPLVGIRGKLPKIAMKGGKEDIDFIFALLDENVKLEEMQQKSLAKEKKSMKKGQPKAKTLLEPVKSPVEKKQQAESKDSTVDTEEDPIADMSFELPEVSICVLGLKEMEGKPWLHFSIHNVVAAVGIRENSLGVTASLGKTTLLDNTVKGKSGPLKVIASPDETHLISFKMNKVDHSSPRFASDFDSTEMKMSLEVTTIQFTVHNETVQTVLHFIEALELSKAPPPPPSLPRRQTPALQSTPPPEDSPFTQLKLDAKLEKLKVVLVSNESRVADFAIEEPTVGLKMLSSGEMNVDAKMKDLVLLDSRDGMKDGVTRIVSRLAESSSEFLVDVTYNKSASGEHFVIANLNDLHIVGAINFTLYLVHFVQSLIQDDLQKIKETVPESSTSVKTLPPPTDVQFKVNNSKVFILDDAKNRETRALLVEIGATGRVLLKQESQKFFVAIPGLAVHTCFYHQRTTPSSEIVQPLSLQFTYAVNLAEKKTRITVETPAIIASVDPHTVHIIQNVVNRAVETWEELKPANNDDQVATETSPSDLWDAKPVDETRWYYQKDAEADEKRVDQSTFARSTSVMERHRRVRQGSQVSTHSMPVADIVKGEAEEMIIEIEKMEVKLENESKGWFYPVIAIDASAKAELTNWSKELCLDASLQLEVSYFNERMSVWEPLLEPVPKSDFTYRQWRLNASVKQHKVDKEEENPAQFAVLSTQILRENEDEHDGKVIKTSGAGVDLSERRESITEVEMPPAAIAVTISSEDPLELTVTKTALNVVQKLVKVWTGEEKNPNQLSSSSSLSPYLVENKCGRSVTIIPGPGFEDKWDKKGVAIGKGSSQPLRFQRDTRHQFQVLSATFNADSVDLYQKASHFITIEVQGFKQIPKVPITKAGRLLYLLESTENSTKAYQGLPLVCEIELVEAQKIVTICSSFKIQNDLTMDVDVYTDGTTEPVAQLKPLEKYCAPLLETAERLFSVSPAGFGYKPSEPFNWKTGKTKGDVQTSCIYCVSETPDAELTEFVIRLVAEPGTFDNVKEVSKTVPHHTMHLHMPFVIHNLLPRNLSGQVEGHPDDFQIDEGSKKVFTSINVDSAFTVFLSVKDQMGRDWTGKASLDPYGDSELTEFAMSADGKTSMMFGVRVWTKTSVEAYFYVPYWMVNKTGTALEYKADGGSGVIHDSTVKDGLMFGLPKAGSKRKIRVKAFGSDWSKAFPLDAAGSGGNIKCKENERTYELGLQVRLTSFGLSRIVTFSPYQIVVNKTSDKIFIYEGKAAVPMTIDPGEWEPYWAEGKTGLMAVKLRSNEEPMSRQFAFNKGHSTLLKLNGEVSSVFVQVELSDSSSIISFGPYFDGSAPVRLENHLSKEKIIVDIFQREEEKVDTPVTVDAGSSQTFTWQNPLGKRFFCWSFPQCDPKQKYQNKLQQDAHGTIANLKGVVVYWASFLDGLQRVVMFTDDKAEMLRATETEHIEQADFEFTLSIPSVGVSLVDDHRSVTVSYVSISSSGLVWEFKPLNKKRFRSESYEMCQKLEAVFKDASKASSSDLKVDFKNANDLKILQPKAGSLRRTQHQGIWFQFSMSRHHIFIHGIINRLQIDNQMKENVFPIVFNPVPPPKSVASQAAPKPWLEGSVVINRTEQSNIMQIKYLMVLVQEMAVRVDMGLINNLISLFSPENWDEAAEAQRFKQDLDFVRRSILETSAVKAVYEGQRLYISYLHMSPIKVHVSFSMDAPGSDQLSGDRLFALPTEIIKVLMKSVGIVLTDVQDVELRLAYFEVMGQSWTEKQLLGGIQKHYTTQAIKQMYALILGLDVIGNPFGLVTDIKDGVFDLFYEPYQGAIQGPGEFAVGVAYGFQSLMSHTVGGVFGAVSRVTGTLGKGLTKLTLDDEYEKEKAQAKKPKGVKEGLTKGATGLLKGLVGGLTGIVTKPVEGAKRGGVEGFFKGFGKGLIGVVARPVGGVVDFATNTFQGISSAADLETAATPRRPARFIPPDRIVHPYCFHTASGNGILQVVEDGKFASDTYFGHNVILVDPKIVFLLTNKNLIVIKEGFFDSSEQSSAFATPLSEILEIRERDNAAIFVVLKTIKKSFFGKSGDHEQKGFKAPLRDARKYALKKAHEALIQFAQQ